jgi:hypothetical protein
MKKFILILSIVLSGCGGGGGSPTTQPVTQSQSVIQSSCVLKQYATNVPQEYYGSHSIPTPNSKFDSNILRGIGVKDYYPNHFDANCGQYEYARLLYKKTLDRLQALNVDYVEVYQYGIVNNFNDSTWVVDKSNWQIPESELIWFIKEANSRKIKVNLTWQLWGIDKLGNTIDTTRNASEAHMLKVLRGWRNIIVEMAKLGGNNELSMLSIQWNAFYFPIVIDYPESATQEFLLTITEIRKYYNGKLFMSASPIFFDKRLVDKVDAIIVPLTPTNWSYNDDNNISVSLLKDRYKDSILGQALRLSIATGMNANTIPVIWDFNIQSRDKALSGGWVEDGFCIKEGGDGAPLSWGHPECAKQMNYVTDFSIQALAIEGAFQAIKEQTYIKTYGVNFSTNYWHTDTLVPGQEGFPNLSQSIRGKPAENVVKHWFSKN